MAPRGEAAATEAARSLEEAERFLDIQVEQALEAADTALASYRTLGDARGAARALAIAVGARFRRSYGEAPDEAIRLAEEELAASQERGDTFAEASMKVALAEINLDRRGDQKRAEALEMARDAKAAFIGCQDKAMEAKATQLIASVLVKSCDRGGGPRCAKEALKYAREACAMSKELNDRQAEAKSLYLLFSAKMYTEATWRDGVRYAREAATLFEETGNRWWQGTVLRTIADWALMKGDGHDGLPYAQQALEIFRDIESKMPNSMGWEASALAAVVGAHAALGDEGTEAAVQVAKEGAERLKARGHKQSAAQASQLLAAAHMLSEDYDDALQASEEALRLHRELGNKALEARILHEISEIHQKADDKTRALEAYQDSVSVAQEAGDIRYQARSLSSIVRVHLSQKDPDRALVVASEAIALYQQIDDREGQGVVLLNMCSAHMCKEHFEEALDEAEEAIGLFAALENKEREAQCCCFQAEAYGRSGRPEQALKCATSARALYQKVYKPSEEADSLHRVALCNLSIAEKVGQVQQKEDERRTRKAYTSALKAGKEGLAIARRLPSDKDPKRTLQSNLLAVVAQSLAVLGKHKDALKSANEALRIAMDIADREAECSAYLLLAQVHHCNGNIDEARVFANRALDLAQKAKDEHLEAFAANFLVEMEPQAYDAAPAGAAHAAAPASSAGGLAVESAGDAGAGAIGPYKGPSPESLVPKINELALALLATEELDQDTPLMDSGLDSLSMVQFRNTLQHQFPGVPMPASMIFDHPSVRAVAENIVEELKSAHEAGRPIL